MNLSVDGFDFEFLEAVDAFVFVSQMACQKDVFLNQQEY